MGLHCRAGKQIQTHCAAPARQLKKTVRIVRFHQRFPREKSTRSSLHIGDEKLNPILAHRSSRQDDTDGMPEQRPALGEPKSPTHWRENHLYQKMNSGPTIENIWRKFISICSFLCGAGASGIACRIFARSASPEYSPYYAR